MCVCACCVVPEQRAGAARAAHVRNMCGTCSDHDSCVASLAYLTSHAVLSSHASLVISCFSCHLMLLLSSHVTIVI